MTGVCRPERCKVFACVAEEMLSGIEEFTFWERFSPLQPMRNLSKILFLITCVKIFTFCNITCNTLTDPKSENVVREVCDEAQLKTWDRHCQAVYGAHSAERYSECLRSNRQRYCRKEQPRF